MLADNELDQALKDFRSSVNTGPNWIGIAFAGLWGGFYPIAFNSSKPLLWMTAIFMAAIIFAGLEYYLYLSQRKKHYARMRAAGFPMVIGPTWFPLFAFAILCLVLISLLVHQNTPYTFRDLLFLLLLVSFLAQGFGAWRASTTRVSIDKGTVRIFRGNSEFVFEGVNASDLEVRTVSFRLKRGDKPTDWFPLPGASRLQADLMYLALKSGEGETPQDGPEGSPVS